MSTVTAASGPARSAPPRGRLWTWFVRIVAPQQRLLWLGLVLLFVNAGCRLAQPWLVMRAIDDYLIGDRVEGFGGLLAIFFGIAVLEMVARWGQQTAIETAGHRALLRLRRRVFAHLQRLPSQYFDRSPTGRLVGRITTDIEALQEMFSSGVVTVLGDVVFLVVGVWLMASLHVPLTGTVMFMVPVLIAVTLFVRTRVRRAYSKMRTRLADLNGFLHEQVSGMAIVQMFGQEARRAGEFGEVNGDVCEAQLRSVRWESVLSAATELLSSFTTALIVWIGGGFAIDAGGDAASGLTLGVLFAFVDYMQRFFVPLNDLSLKYTVLQNGVIAGERLVSLLDEPVEHDVDAADRAVGAVEADRSGTVAFRNVSFAYEEGNDVLHDVSFEVAPGESVAIVGATGSGKSTVLSLLTRLYDVERGRVELDGRDVREFSRAEVRKRVGLVLQDPFLFHGSILDNLMLGSDAGSRADALTAARSLNLDRVVRRLADGYDEVVAERGKSLSAGERQLIALARMLVTKPEVLLLDEATSNVDTQTEELLQEAVHRLSEGRTTIVVAHRLSTIKDVDRILVMHRGKLVEEGSHEELLRARGVYWRLYRLQYAALD